MPHHPGLCPVAFRWTRMDNMRGLGTTLPQRGGKKGAKPPPRDEDEEDEDDEEFVPSADQAAAIRAALASNNPALLKALNAKLASMVGKPSGYLDELPSKVCAPLKTLSVGPKGLSEPHLSHGRVSPVSFQVKRRVEALEALQEEHDKLHEQFLVRLPAREPPLFSVHLPRAEGSTATGAARTWAHLLHQVAVARSPCALAHASLSSCL